MVQPTRDGLKVLSAVACAVVAAFMGYVTLTVPIIATTGPAILTIGFAAAAVLLWRSSPIPPPPSPKTRQLGGQEYKDYS